MFFIGPIRALPSASGRRWGPIRTACRPYRTLLSDRRISDIAYAARGDCTPREHRGHCELDRHPAKALYRPASIPWSEQGAACALLRQPALIPARAF